MGKSEMRAHQRRDAQASGVRALEPDALLFVMHWA
ncbi:unnamed protein product [Victoria cruziana]